MKLKFLILFFVFGSCRKENIQQVLFCRELTKPFTEEQTRSIELNKKIKWPYNSPVILLDFDGYILSKSVWATDTVILANSGLIKQQQKTVFDKVADAFKDFDVLVETDERFYQMANPSKRMRCILTTSSVWSGYNSGGVAFINSFQWGDNTPCFVFTELLGFNVNRIKEVAAHEIGHTMGLRHQSIVEKTDSTCKLIAEYNTGFPIMGNSQYSQTSGWIKGFNPYCAAQNDMALLGEVLRKRP